jgi:hypothetical protein
MIITSVLVTFSYRIILTVKRSLGEDEKSIYAMTEMFWLNRELSYLTESSESIILIDDQLQFNLTENAVFLEFSDSVLYIFREGSENGTFYPLSTWKTEYLTVEHDYISRFEFTIPGKSMDCSFTFKKVYPKKFLYHLKDK